MLLIKMMMMLITMMIMMMTMIMTTEYRWCCQIGRHVGVRTLSLSNDYHDDDVDHDLYDDDGVFMVMPMMILMMIMKMIMMTGRWWSIDSIAIYIFTNRETAMLFCWHSQGVVNVDEDNGDDDGNNK